MKATGRKVIIKISEDVYSGKLIMLATIKKEQPSKGVVFKVGSSDKIDPEIVPGATVIFNKYSVTEFTIDGERYVAIDCDYVLAVIK